ncbi:MAG: LemA family protein [Planctomycetota bacterium]
MGLIGIVLAIMAGFAVLVFGVAGYAAKIYNELIKLQNRYENMFAQIDVQLTRRHDLIPNLVETAKGYMSHEKETLEAVVQARNQAVSASQSAVQNPGDPNAMQQLSSAEGQLNSAIGRLLMVAEDYPDLKANENMLLIQEELTATENKVAYARQGYNDSVTRFNTHRETFPAVLIAGFLGFVEANLLEATETERQAPKVSFD